MVGMLGHIGIAKETTWGTGVAAANFIEALSEGFVSDIERFETRNIIGGLYEPDDEAGIKRHEGELVFAVHPEIVGYVLNGVMGSNSVTVVLSGSLHTNEFFMADTIQNSLHPLPPYTFEVYRPGATDVSTAFQFAGAQFTSAEFNISPNQDLRCTTNMIAKTRNMIAKTTPTFPSSPVGPFTWDVASLELGGAAVARVEALTINIDNQLEGVPTIIASDEIAKVRRTGSQMIRLSGTVEFEDFTDFDTFRNQTEQAVRATLTMTDSFQLVFDVPRAIFIEYPVQMGGRDRVTVDFEMMARYHTGSASALRVGLTTVNTF